VPDHNENRYIFTVGKIKKHREFNLCFFFDRFNSRYLHFGQPFISIILEKSFKSMKYGTAITKRP
jgi:hypothetical protein